MTTNIAYECLTKYAKADAFEKEAINWIHSDLSCTSQSYHDIESESNRIANTLAYFGITQGDVVSLFLPRQPILVSAFFACQKIQAIACVLFSTLGESALFDRLENSRTKILITKKSLVRRIVAIKSTLPDLKAIFVIDADNDESDYIYSLPGLLQSASVEFPFSPLIEAETPAFLQYTSGSTGKPKGALHVHEALVEIENSFREVMQLQQGDIYWCTADPAWITGLVYGIMAPLTTQIEQVQFLGGYNMKSWMSILQNESISVWFTAPTALRMLMMEDESKFDSYDFSRLNRIYCVGEPLNPEVYYWAKKIFNVEVYDTWFQSETGCIMIANKPGQQIKPGSMGKPRTGINVSILNEDLKPIPDGQPGNLCLQKGWQSMFRAYYRKEIEYNEKFIDDQYFTGDLAKIDEDGYIWYISRADDVINSAGHLVGPFEVESALLEVNEIADVAVIGADDPILHKKIIAFIVLKTGLEWSKELELRCRIHVSNTVSSTAIPSEFIIVDKVYKNQSGKIMRRVMKAIYEGKNPGDLSTME